MINILTALQGNYGTLVIAAIAFAVVQTLAYFYREHVAKLSEEQAVAEPVSAEELRRQVEQLVRQQEDRLNGLHKELRRELLAELQLDLSKAARRQAGGKSLAASVLSNARSSSASSSSSVYVGELRHKRGRAA
ncbi:MULTISPECIES: hypothetical protein [unclassified Caballeronia]|uniref:hypothetical protein n=1 Tax=unclassified Caballeronia TaxID=2646786 RepID=UPI001FD0E6F0|nr:MULTISPECIES: hypothetical protein [unclassified Caballeronia]